MSNKTIETMVTHPIATWLIVSTATSGIAQIIKAIKGTDQNIKIGVVEETEQTDEN